MTEQSARFTGEAWDGPATWGQQGFRDGLRRYDNTGWYANTAPLWTVPDGATTAQVLAAIGAAVSRHEGLRTVFTDGPDVMHQRVLATGELPVEIVDGTGDPARAAARTAARLRTAELSLTGGLPLAVALVTDAGVPRHVVAGLSHLAVDASAVRILLAGASGAGVSAAAPLQPRGLVGQAAHQRRSDRAVQFWRAECARAQLPFATPRPGHCGVVQGALTSAAAAGRLERLSAAAGVNSTAVLLAVIAVVAGQRTVPMQLTTSNRHLPGVGDYVGVLAQLAPLTADVEQDQPFGALAQRLQEQSMRSYRNAFWSPSDLDTALRADGSSADAVLGAGWTFNDARGPWPRVEPVEPDPGRDFALRPLDGWPYQGGRCAITAAGTPLSLTVAVRLDTAYVDGALLHPLLTAIDAVLRHAHDEGPGVAVGALTAASGGVFAPA